MKNRFVLFSLLLLMSAGFAHQVFADTVQGTLKSVDESAKKMEIDANNGLKSIAYTSKTKWPAGVTAPSELVGENVKVEQDDLLEDARLVEKV